MENQTNNMYNPLVKAAAPNGIDDLLFNAPEDYLQQRDVEDYDDNTVYGHYWNSRPQDARVANDVTKPRWTDNPANRLMNAAREAAGTPRWTDNPASMLMNTARETAKAAPGTAAVQKDMAEGAGHKNPYDPNSTGGSKSPGVTPTNAPKTSWEALLDTIKKYYGFAKNNIKASGGVLNWLGGNSKTLGNLPRWAVAGGGLAGLLGLGLGARSLLSKSGSYHPVQGLPMAKLASARAMRAEDPTLLGGVSAGRPDITEGNSIGRMLEIIRTHGNQNAPYGATMPKSAADESEGQEKEDEKKKLKVSQSGALKRTLTAMGATAGGTLLGGGLGALAGNAIGGDKGLLAGMLLGSLAGGGTGLYAGDRIAVGNEWIPDELSTTPGQIASTMGGALAGGIPAAIASRGKLGFLGAVGGGLLGNYLHKKLSGRQYPNYEVVDDL